jgi:DNA repair protein RecO (recombination protein O)
MTVGSCELMQSTFGAGSRDPEAAMTLAYVAELVDAFAPEGQAEAALYRLARAVPHALEASVPPVWVARYAEAWTLRLHGIFPSLDRCASCGSALQDAELRYDDRAQGFLCPACGRATGPVLSSEARLCLQQMFSRPPSEPRPASAADLEEIESLHRKLITRHIERDLRSYRVMRDVARELHR